MAQDDAGVARNRCPLCERPTRVAWLLLLDVKGRPDSFRCSSCGQGLFIAPRTKQLAGCAAMTSIGRLTLSLDPAGDGRAP